MKNIKEKVLELTKKISKGKVTTYGELAIAIGKPKAYRLIGKILSSNPYPNSIPCFKVVKSNGGIGGYSLGVREKIKRLEREGIEVKNGKVDLNRYFCRIVKKPKKPRFF